VRKATLTIMLKHRHDRPRTQAGVEAELRERLRAMPGARVSVGMGDVGERLQVVLAGDDPELLEKTSRAVERELRTLPNVGNITSNASLQRPEIHVKVDFGRAADLGVTTQAMASAVRVATAGDFEVQLPKLNLPQRQIPIRVRLDQDLRQDLGRSARCSPRLTGYPPCRSCLPASRGSRPATPSAWPRCSAASARRC
jgi:multidrug efflux pump subunit AcrB